MYNDQSVYHVDIWTFFGNSLWIEKVSLTSPMSIK